MNTEPNWEQAISETYLIENESWQMPPGGWLLAITIENGSGSIINGGELHYRARFELTNPDRVALYARINWEYPMRGCGVAFKEPLPNMNATCGYILHRTSPRGGKAPIKVTLTHLMMKYV